MGKVPYTKQNLSMMNVSLLVKDYFLSDLWRLDVLRTTDPGGVRSKQL